MKRFGALILIVCIIMVSIPALPLFADTPTVSICASHNVLVPGQTLTISITSSSPATLTSDNPSVVDLAPGYTNVVVAKGKGTAVITATIDGTNIKASMTIKVRTPTGLISGEDYYIMNSQTK